MRPCAWQEIVGQDHVLGPGRLIRELIEQKRLASLLLWGPPGSGKTTLARLYAEAVGAFHVALSAVSSGVRELRETAEGARLRGMVEGLPTVLFVDEIHRFNRAQQDALLPFVESGQLTLIGATTENPGFEVNNALRSRCRVVVLHGLGPEDMSTLVTRALQDSERGLGPTAPAVDPVALEQLTAGAQGDARQLLNTLEIAASLAAREAPPGEPGLVLTRHVEEALQRRMALWDKRGDQHYMLASAFIKSMRGSDPDAALYWMVRMLEAGEDPLFLCRRMVIFASEDVGNAEPRALQVALDATRAFELVGMPEGVLAMVQACTFLATAPKSNAVLRAYSRVRRDVLATPDLQVPRHLVQAANAVLRQMGAGRGYRYPHDFEGHYVPQRHLPERLRDQRYYVPSDQGHEQVLSERLDQWHRIRRDAEE
jgi:putative ATPase